MKKIISILFVVQMFLMTGNALAQNQSIFVIKGGDFPQHKEAIDGFWEVMRSSGHRRKDSLEYLLQEDNMPAIRRAVKEKKPKLIFAVGNSAAKAFAKSNIPLVFAMVLEPVRHRIVDNLENPGKNITGVTLDVPVKYQLRAIKETIPGVKKVGVIYSAASAELITDSREIVKDLDLELITQVIRKEGEVMKAFDRLVDSKIDILWLVPDLVVLRGGNRRRLLEGAKKNKISVYGPTAAFLKGEFGATISLSPDFQDIGREAGRLSLRILEGETNISIQSPKKYTLFVKERTRARIPKGAVVIR